MVHYFRFQADLGVYTLMKLERDTRGTLQWTGTETTIVRGDSEVLDGKEIVPHFFNGTKFTRFGKAVNGLIESLGVKGGCRWEAYCGFQKIAEGGGFVA